MKKGLYIVISDGHHIFKQGELVEVTETGVTLCATNGFKDSHIYHFRLEYIGAI